MAHTLTYHNNQHYHIQTFRDQNIPLSRTCLATKAQETTVFLLAGSSQTLGKGSKTKTLKDAVETKCSQKAIDEPTKTETAQLHDSVSTIRQSKKMTGRHVYTYQSADKVKNTGQKQANGGQDLEEWLVEKTPERVELLLRMRHVFKLSLGVLDALGNVTSEVFEDLSQMVLLRSGLARSSLVFGVGCDAAIGIETFDDTFGLGEDTTAFLDQRLDFPDERLFVPLILGSAFGFVDFLLFKTRWSVTDRQVIKVIHVRNSPR